MIFHMSNFFTESRGGTSIDVAIKLNQQIIVVSPHSDN